MTTTNSKSKSTTDISQTDRLVRDKFALLARVGHQKRKASAYQEETEFYYGIVTELLALSGETVAFLQEAAIKVPALSPFVNDVTSRQHHLIKQLLNFWPQNSESQRRILDLLDVDGLETLMGTTQDGYLSLSSDLILENVERCFAAIRAESPSPSSNSTEKTTSPPLGTSGSDEAST